MTSHEVVEWYVAAWNATDEAERRRLLERAWTEDGFYTDPTVHVAGREALIAHIGAFHGRTPGAWFDVIAGPDGHHQRVRFIWRLNAHGITLREDLDVGECAEDGRLRGIVGFFGPLPAVGQ